MDREDNIAKMGLTVEVDRKSGFCYGVIKAVKQAENFLNSNEKIYSLGAIVHNNTELSRLKELGMEVVDHTMIDNLKSSVLFIRAHGEPPSTYELAAQKGLTIMDCTCPVVLKLQERIRTGYKEIKKVGGTILIFGKRGHAEVNGLVGQVDGDAIVIENENDLSMVNFTKPIMIFSQTTKDPGEYLALIFSIKKRIIEQGAPLERFTSHNTICRQVSSRHPHLKLFSTKHSVIIFVSGRESSNGKVLYETCLSVNPKSYKIECISDIDTTWFTPGDSVGICGATSTPMWQLEEVAKKIREL
ncbi:MAG: 4-hydroxy-3-methylbut-2-enyl diphosphate reductase [Bacteroidales bacterium]|nr:4-hydroxy-3-methylbut-2-enyl diphosphate reductase [Bacteroidales bacterium]